MCMTRKNLYREGREEYAKKREEKLLFYIFAFFVFFASFAVKVIASQDVTQLGKEARWA